MGPLPHRLRDRSLFGPDDGIIVAAGQQGAGSGALEGLQRPDQILAFFAAFWEAFPDLQLTITHSVEEGCVVAVRGTMTGTHLGVLRTPSGDIPATNQHVTLSFSDDYELRDGLIVSTHLHLDRLALLEQLGVVPAPVSA